MNAGRWKKCAGLTLLALVGVGVVGCSDPLKRSTQAELREQVLASNRAFLAAVAAGPVVELKRPPSEVESELSEADRAELDRLAGPSAHVGDIPDLGVDLVGNVDSGAVQMSLQRAIQLAVQNSLDVRIGKLIPAVGELQVTQAEAVFDATLFGGMDMQLLDTPRPASSTPSLGPVQSRTFGLSGGIKKFLSTGGQIALQTQTQRLHQDPSSYSLGGASGFNYHDANVLLSLNQPLLRNFGSDVSEAQIVLSRSAKVQGQYDLKKTLVDTCLATEQAYWNLVISRQRLVVMTQLLKRTIEDRDRIKKRMLLDASRVQLTEASSAVEQRRADVIRSRQAVRQASDQLKRLVNAPELPLSSELQIVPIEQPVDMPVQYSLLDSVTTALRRRPELQKALLQIDDSTTRQMVADNAKLPQLNFTGGIRFNGIGDDRETAYQPVGEGSYIDYLLGLEFEMPIGNRAAEALYSQRLLERKAAVLAYQRQSQDVVLEVKEGLRALLTSYELIAATRSARRAAADNLRALQAQEDLGRELTPEFLDLKLSAQARVADTEMQEIQALADYQIAISKYYQAMGTILERNGVDFKIEPEKRAGR